MSSYDSSTSIIWRFRGGVSASASSDLMRRLPELVRSASTFSFSETSPSSSTGSNFGLRLPLLPLASPRFDVERRGFLGEVLNGRSFLMAHSSSMILRRR